MIVLGIDGGGSQTRALLSNASGRILGRSLSGPTNPRSTPAAEWRRHLQDVIREACRGNDPREIRAAHLGIAGAGDAPTHESLAAAARDLLSSESTRITVGHDLETALEGGLAGAPGIVLVAGTGSAGYGRDARGKVAESGGWGDLVDDAGGGSWFGLRALQACARQADGRLPESALMEKVLAFLEIDSMADFKTRIHGQGLPRKERAALAPLVIELAEAGNAAAGSIMAEAVSELCQLAVSVRRQLKLLEPRILLCGGLTGHGFFRAALAEGLRAEGMQPCQPRLSAEAGAVLLALKSVGLEPHEETLARLEAPADKLD